MKNGYESFGRFLLSHLQFNINPDDIDWTYICNQFDLKNKLSIPGLMYINWIVCDHFQMDPYEVRTKKTRKREYIIPKHTVIYLATMLYRYTQEKIVEFYNLKDRSSVSNSNIKIQGLIDTDKFFREDVNRIKNKLIEYGKTYKE